MLEWILGNSIVAALFAAAVLIAGRFLRTRPALVHALWLVTGAVLIAPPIPWIETPGASFRRQVSPLLATDQGSVWSMPGQLPASVLAWPERPEHGVDTASHAAADPSASADAAGGAPGEAPLLAARYWLLAVWLVGALVVLARSGVRIRAFQRLMRGTGDAPEDLREEVECVARRVGIDAPTVRTLSGVASPSVWCLGRPRLLWPREDTENPSSTARSTLIAHELAHLARRDHWVSWLEVPAAALLWWNPLFWLIRGRIRHFAELACDAWAVRAYPADRRAFAEALIDMQARTAFAPVALMGLGATDSEFKNFEWRLNMIMKKRVSPGVSKTTTAIAVLAAVLTTPGWSDSERSDSKDTKATVAAVATRVEIERAFKKAEKLYENGDSAAALAAYEGVLALEPDHAKAHMRMGYILIGQGDHAGSFSHLKRQYQLGHEQPTALYNMACAKALAGKREGALEVLASAVQHGFGNTDLMASDEDLATIRSEPKFETLLNQAQGGKMLRKELARLKEAGDDAGFLVAHGELAEILESNGPLLSEHGHLALQAGDFERAIWAFGRQAEVQHNTPTALYNRACARSRAGDVDGAIADLQKSAEEGMAYAGIVDDTDLANARKDARFAALETTISEPALAQKELKTLLQSGDLEAGAVALKKIAKDESEDPAQRAWAARKLGMVMYEHGRLESALKSFEYAADLGENIEVSAFHIAETLNEMGDAASALQHASYAVELGYADIKKVEAFLGDNSVCSEADADQLMSRTTKNAKAADYGSKKYGKKAAWSAGEKSKKKGYGKSAYSDA